jgi:DNA-binding protein HU-beta
LKLILIKSGNVNRDDLSRAVYKVHGGMSFAEAQSVVGLVFDLIKARLADGEKVVLSGFGCFRVVDRKDRKGVNPKTGESMLIRGRRAIKFKPSKYIRSV